MLFLCTIIVVASVAAVLVLKEVPQHKVGELSASDFVITEVKEN